MNTSPALRTPCPPGVCSCHHRELLDDPQADWRILRLTRHEERRLASRLEQVASLDELQQVQQKMFAQLGIRMQVAPGLHEVRTARGIHVDFSPQPGLCHKSCQSLAAALRRAMVAHPELAWRLLDSFDLLRDA